MSNNGDGFDLRTQIKRAATQYKFMMARRNAAVEIFGTARAEELEKATRKLLYEPSQIRTTQNISMLNAFELALQIEAEHRGRFEEIVRRAWLLVDDTEGQVGGILQGISQVLLTERSKRGSLSGDS